MNAFTVIMSCFKIKNGNKISETERWVDVGYRNRGDYAQMLSNLFPYTFKFRGKKLQLIMTGKKVARFIGKVKK